MIGHTNSKKKRKMSGGDDVVLLLSDASVRQRHTGANSGFTVPNFPQPVRIGHPVGTAPAGAGGILFPIITVFGIIALLALTIWSLVLLNRIEDNQIDILRCLDFIKECLETVIKPALVLLQTCVDDIKTKVTQLVTTDIPLIQECLNFIKMCVDEIKNTLIPALTLILTNIFTLTTVIHDKTVAQMATWPAPQCDDNNNCTSDIFRFGGCMYKPVPDLTPCNDTVCFTGGNPHCHDGECQDSTCLGNCDFVGFARALARRARSGVKGREVITTGTGFTTTTTSIATTTPAPQECPDIMFRTFLECDCWTECSPDNFCKYFCTHRDGADSFEHLVRDCGHNEAIKKVCLDIIDSSEPLKECLNVNVHCPADLDHFDDKRKKLETKRKRSFVFEQEIICQYHFKCVTPMAYDAEACARR